MKKIILLALTVFLFSGFAAAQEQSAQNRLGFSIGINNNGFSDVQLKYDMQFLRILGGLSVDIQDGVNEFQILVGAEALLAESLMPFGAGGFISYETEEKNFGLVPYFLIETELVDNLALGLNVGLVVSKHDEDDIALNLFTRASLTWYFL